MRLGTEAGEAALWGQTPPGRLELGVLYWGSWYALGTYFGAPPL